LKSERKSLSALRHWIPAFVGVEKLQFAVIPAQEGVEKRLFAVIPAKAGIPKHLKPMDSCRSLLLQAVGRGRNDGEVGILYSSTPSLADDLLGISTGALAPQASGGDGDDGSSGN
jgi:hypothetical protein